MSIYGIFVRLVDEKERYEIGKEKIMKYMLLVHSAEDPWTEEARAVHVRFNGAL
jgi:hypothetical protein